MIKRSKILSTPAARRLAEDRGIDLAAVKGTGEFGSVIKRDVESYREERKVTPVAQKMAQYLNVDINEIKTDGKVSKKDIELAAILKEKAAHDNVPKEARVETLRASRLQMKVVKMQGMRKVIAKRMVESLNTAAQYTMCSEFDTTNLLALVKDSKQAYSKLGGGKLTVTDFLVKLVALAIERHPVINTTVKGDEIAYLEEVNIGIAVALDEGLIVPVVKNANKLSISEISQITQDLVNRGRLGKLLPDEYSGSTFTISNLGMYPVDFSTPVINQPENGILGVGRSQEKAVVVDGEIKIRSMTGFSLTLDHRVIDGAEGAKFLKTFNELLSDPLCILL
jgi:pyruvate dehydrogenase E2 component (dihydrolipoamide acetyltransferase)